MPTMTRRRALVALAPVIGAGAAAKLAGVPLPAAANEHADAHRDHAHGSDHAGFKAGSKVDHRRNGFHPTALLRDFDYGTTRRLPDGRTLREWTLEAREQEIEVAPGVKFLAWSYNGRVPGPTLRATEGDRLRITLKNVSAHPHTIHFHGLHPATMDGVPNVGAGLVGPGQSTVYEFDAEPFGLHLYHCHASPLAPHIAKGLYGAFIIDPKDGRKEADELVMVMNGFDTNFDRSNEVYGANSIPFAYMEEPVQITRGELVRIYLVNVLEFDLINSFHVHGNFFDWYPTGTRLEPVEFTDTVMLCQGQRGIAEICFKEEGHFMFHAHQSEFTELGWMGFFDVRDGQPRAKLACEVKG
jgi:FtsP/CotA-like multicopper oxidase with cupredoxin domain